VGRQNPLARFKFWVVGRCKVGFCFAWPPDHGTALIACRLGHGGRRLPGGGPRTEILGAADGHAFTPLAGGLPCLSWCSPSCWGRGPFPNAGGGACGVVYNPQYFFRCAQPRPGQGWQGGSSYVEALQIAGGGAACWGSLPAVYPACAIVKSPRCPVLLHSSTLCPNAGKLRAGGLGFLGAWGFPEFGFWKKTEWGRRPARQRLSPRPAHTAILGRPL